MARKNFISFQFLGLRVTRLIEWGRVMRLESRQLTLRTLKKMTLLATLAIFRPLDRRLVLARYRICLKCIHFDWTNRRCRDGEHGCGCYCPYLVVSSREPCWIKRNGNGKRGWE